MLLRHQNIDLFPYMSDVPVGLVNYENYPQSINYSRCSSYTQWHLLLWLKIFTLLVNNSGFPLTFQLWKFTHKQAEGKAHRILFSCKRIIISACKTTVNWFYNRNIESEPPFWPRLSRGSSICCLFGFVDVSRKA